MANGAGAREIRLPFFVYGTLLPGQPNHGLLRAAAVRLRPARLGGFGLLDLFHYPMMIARPGHHVVGLVVDLDHSAYDDVVVALDYLEGYDAANPAESEYRRERRIARLADGREAVVWTYVGYPGQGAPSNASAIPLVAGGDWKRHVRERAAANEAWWSNVTTVGRGSSAAAGTSSPQA